FTITFTSCGSYVRTAIPHPSSVPQSNANCRRMDSSGQRSLNDNTVEFSSGDVGSGNILPARRCHRPQSVTVIITCDDSLVSRLFHYRFAGGNNHRNSAVVVRHFARIDEQVHYLLNKSRLNEMLRTDHVDILSAGGEPFRCLQYAEFTDIAISALLVQVRQLSGFDVCRGNAANRLKFPSDRSRQFRCTATDPSLGRVLRRVV